MLFTLITREEFDKLVDEAIKSIPKEFRDKFDNVDVFIEDWPTWEQLRKLGAGLLLGLYEGVPQTRRGRYGIGPTLPDRITIFRGPIIRIAKSSTHIKKLVKETVLHEVGHHFGMSEEEIRSVESKRT